MIKTVNEDSDDKSSNETDKKTCVANKNKKRKKIIWRIAQTERKASV